MKQKIKKFLLPVSAVGSAILPMLASAQSKVDQGLSDGRFQQYFGSAGLSSSASLTDLIFAIIRILLLLSGMIAVVFVIIGGYQYVTSAGNEESAEKGRKTVTNAIIGIIIIVLSYVIISVISNLVSTGGAGF